MIVRTTMRLPVVAKKAIAIITMAVNKESSDGAGTTVKQTREDIFVLNYQPFPNIHVNQSVISSIECLPMLSIS